MKKKATKTTNATNGNGTRPKGRSLLSDRAKWVAEHYPELSKKAGTMALGFEIVTPKDAKFVSGFLRDLVAQKCTERMGELADFRRQAKLDRLVASESKHKAALAELASLRKSLGG